MSILDQVDELSGLAERAYRVRSASSIAIPGIQAFGRLRVVPSDSNATSLNTRIIVFHNPSSHESCGWRVSSLVKGLKYLG